MSIAGKAVSAALLVVCGFTLRLAPAAEPVSGRTVAAAAPNTEQADREANKKAVLAFYDAIVKLDFEAARQYIGPYYIEHDPEREDGLPGLQKALEYARRHGNRQNIVHELVVADGELVAVYSSSTPITSMPPGLPPRAEGPAGGGPTPQPNLVGDIFRLQNGKIVEHWNAIYRP